MNVSRRSILRMAALSTVVPTTAFAERSTALITKEIPSSGEAIPVIGLGTNRYGIGDDLTARQPLREVLWEFAQAGGGLIDTAPMYRNSETVLGELIAHLNLGNQFFMATKCDVDGGEETRKQLADSKEKLQSGNLDLVAVHNIKNWQRQLPVLQEAKQQSAIKYVGITTSRSRQYEEFKTILETEDLDFMQINYSLADRGAQPLLDLAHRRGIAVMVNLAFGRGKLFTAVKGRELPPLAAEIEANSWAQFFLKYVVSHPAVVCAIPGTTKLRHLRDNLGAAAGRLPDAKERVQMEKFFDAL